MGAYSCFALQEIETIGGNLNSRRNSSVSINKSETYNLEKQLPNYAIRHKTRQEFL